MICEHEWAVRDPEHLGHETIQHETCHLCGAHRWTVPAGITTQFEQEEEA